MQSPIFVLHEVRELHFDDMAEQFTGMTVSLTLSNSAQLRGTVSKVDSTTQILHLRDGISFPYSSI